MLPIPHLTNTSLHSSYFTFINNQMSRIIFLSGALLLASLLSAQKSSLYMPPVFQNAYEKGTRSWDGNPGPNYWQNSASYSIKAEYDPVTRLISGEETILYKNNSRDTIPYLVTKFLQNAYKKGNAKDNEIPEELLTDGVKIGKFIVNGKTYYKDI